MGGIAIFMLALAVVLLAVGYRDSRVTPAERQQTEIIRACATAEDRAQCVADLREGLKD